MLVFWRLPRRSSTAWRPILSCMMARVRDVYANVIGLLPGILVLSFFADRLWQLVRAPNPLDLALVIAIGAGLIYLLLWLQRSLERGPEGQHSLTEATHPGAGE